MVALRKTIALLILTSFIIFKVTFVTTSAFGCPQMCICSTVTGWWTYKYNSNNSLTVDCMGSNVNESTLAQKLDLLLSLRRKKLLTLTISNTPLTQVPMSICQLSNLQKLVLDDNRLTRLPDNCFSYLTALFWLSARRNNITELQDGLFDGLNSLSVLYLSHNMIASIGLHVFSNPNDLVNLTWTYLDHNRLRSLEPWPYIRGLHGSRVLEIEVDTSYNLISEFTNNIEWQLDCSRPSYAYVDIEYNNIRHLHDILDGWHMTYDQWLCIMHMNYFIQDPKTSYFNERRSAQAFTIDYSHSLSYHCDWLDINFFMRARNIIPTFNSFFQKLRCSEPLSLANRLVSDVPLNEFVCELSERCPPGCRCVHRPANYTVHVYCSAANWSSLPLDLPPLPSSKHKYKLDFSNNKLLRRLERRPYFVDAIVLDVSNCAIGVVDFNAWQEFAMMSEFHLINYYVFYKANVDYSLVVMPVVFLHGNQMESLPFSVTEINLTTVHLTLNDNPWECSCDNRWMISWFKSLAASSNVDDILCGSPSRLEGRSIVQSDEVHFCVDSLMRMLKIVLSSTLTVVTGLLMLGCTVYCLRVRLFKRWKFHPFDRDECVGEVMDYDVFLCCSSEDESAHGLHILQLIESKGYRVCYHERDFRPGYIADNILQSILRSKRTLCFISSNFLRR